MVAKNSVDEVGLQSEHDRYRSLIYLTNCSMMRSLDSEFLTSFAIGQVGDIFFVV